MVLLLAGCRTLPTTRYYLLELPPARVAGGSAATDSGDRLRIGVAEALVVAPYDQERIAYRPPGAVQEIAFYHSHRWSAPPARLAREALVEGLDRLAGIAAEPQRDTASYDLVLQPTLLRLVEVDSADGVEAVLELRWRAAASDGTVRHGEASAVEPVAIAEVDAVVSAFAAAFERAAAEIGRELLASP
jgi:ABC-type uncharacterized transport system auxiliary subunit